MQTDRIAVVTKLLVQNLLKYRIQRILVTELSTDTITAVSGKRMLLMIQHNGSARFEKQGISVTFSPDTVNGWKINAEDEIQIGIEKTSETAFSLRIFVRGEEVTEVPGTVVEFQTSVFGGIQSPETVKAEDVQGNQYAVNYQEKQNVLRMEINQTGDYFLTDGKSESIGNQTDEESVEAISDGEDIGFTEEPMPEEVNGAKDRAENREFRQTVSDDNTYITGSMYPGGCHYFCNS